MFGLLTPLVAPLLSSPMKTSSSRSSCSAVGALDRVGFGAFVFADGAALVDLDVRVRTGPALTQWLQLN